MDEASTATDVAEWLQHHGVHTVRVGTVDVDGLWRGKRIAAPYFAESVWRTGTHIANILFGWDVADAILPGLAYTGRHTGFADISIRPDLATLTLTPWEPGTAAVMCDPYERDGSAVPFSPRHQLRRAIAAVEESGYAASTAVELEFYLFDDPAHELRARAFRELTPVTDGNHTYSLRRRHSVEAFLTQVRETLTAADIRVEASSSEYGPGQFEVNLAHCEPLKAADHAVLLKSAVREIAEDHGLTATFMAKVHPEWTGSSAHLHQSLTDSTGSSVFASPSGTELSAAGDHYVGGLLAHAHELSSLYLPNTNSFKRTAAPESWAGTHALWGTDNRTVGVRVLPSTTHSARVENRIAGADANPYLIIAANLWSGLDGIERELAPGGETAGNADTLPRNAPSALPTTLGVALGLLDESEWARRCFGDTFVDHFIATRRWEIASAERAVTDWELDRFLELI